MYQSGAVMSVFNSLTISLTARLLLVLNVAAGSVLAICLWLYTSSQGDVTRAHEEQHIAFLLIDELRQSSDDLTRLARTFVITRDTKYEDQFFEVLDIRNGKKPRPVDIHRDHWDAVAESSSELHHNLKGVSLQDLMARVGVTEEEFAYFSEAQANSNNLVKVKVQAMNAVKGLFDDGSGTYSIKGDPDLALARELLFSPQYHRLKAGIIAPVQRFVEVLEARTNDSIAAAEFKSRNYAVSSIIALVVLIVVSMATFWTLFARVIRPVLSIKAAMADIRPEDVSTPPEGIDRSDEIGEMARALQVFKGKAVVALEASLQLKEAKAQLSDAVECISEGFSLWDGDDRLIMCNDRYRQIYDSLCDIMVPGTTFEEFMREAYKRGVVAQPEGDLERAIRGQVLRHRTSASAFELQLSNGRWIRVSKRKTGTGHVVGIVSDVTSDKNTEEAIRRMALLDRLTELPNRAHFHNKLREAMAHSKRTGRIVGLMLLDLDRFKSVNDTLGHPTGDSLLQQVSARLLECVRETDTVARLGGDEFAVIVANCERSEQVTRLADRIVESLSGPFLIGDTEIHSGTSIGITFFPKDNADPDQLVRNADLALYRAKEHKRGTWRVFDEKINEEVLYQRQLETDLRAAFENDELHVVYQPRVEISTRRIVGAEALLRWHHPRRGQVSPGEFIPAAESVGLIVPMTEWLLQVVCGQIDLWIKQGHAPIRVSVNLSPIHFKNSHLVGQVEKTLKDTDVPAEWLELEITEGIAMEGGAATLNTLYELKELGVKLSIDDFGTGYSSLDRLKNFPVDNLKIDQSFVRDIMVDTHDAAICSAIISLGHNMNINVVAEGVETEEQLEFLAERNCNEIQGFLISHPVEADELDALLRRKFLTRVDLKAKKVV